MVGTVDITTAATGRLAKISNQARALDLDGIPRQPGRGARRAQSEVLAQLLTSRTKRFPDQEAPLPSMTAQTSPNPAFPIPARPSSAPPPASSAALSSSQNGLGRPSTPLGTTTTAARGSGITSSSVNRSLGGLGGLAPAQPPPFDRERAEQALAASSNEADLSLRSLDELRQLDAELDRISVEASELLTFALMMREKETQDKEVYNGMIQVRVLLESSPAFPASRPRWLSERCNA